MMTILTCYEPKISTRIIKPKTKTQNAALTHTQRERERAVVLGWERGNFGGNDVPREDEQRTKKRKNGSGYASTLRERDGFHPTDEIQYSVAISHTEYYPPMLMGGITSMLECEYQKMGAGGERGT